MNTAVSTPGVNTAASKLEQLAQQITEFNKTSNPGTSAVIRLDLGVQFLSLGFAPGEVVTSKRLLVALSENMASLMLAGGELCFEEVSAELLQNE